MASGRIYVWSARVVKFMIHSECGPDHPLAVRVTKGHCSKYFPKEFEPTTRFDTNKKTIYPFYRRRPPQDSGAKAIYAHQRVAALTTAGLSCTQCPSSANTSAT